MPQTETERNRTLRHKKAAIRAEQTIELTALTSQKKRRRLSLEKDNEAWIWEMFGPKSGVDNPLTRRFTSQDCDMIGSFFQTLKFGGSSFTLACRGGGKTSRLRECITKGLVTGELKFEVYFAANQDKADDSREFIDHAVTQSEAMLNLYPEVCEPVRALNFAPSAARGMRARGKMFSNLRRKFDDASIRFQWSQKGLWMPRVPGSPAAGARFESYGLEKPPRGLNKLGSRPTHVSIDDPDTMETTENYDQAKKVIDFINFDIGGLGGESRTVGIDILCTMSHKGEGVAFRLSAEDSQYVVHRHQFLIQAPQRLDLWQKYIELRQRGRARGDEFGREAHWFYQENQESMDAGHKVANMHRFDGHPCPDGSPKELSALQWYYNQWADKGESFAKCELDNERIILDDTLTATLTNHHVAHNCTGELPRLETRETSILAVTGVDVRKVELHWCSLSQSEERRSHIYDYNLHEHGHSETTVEQAEGLVLESLYKFLDYLTESYGRTPDLTLIDKGWIGSWKEDGEIKTWATQPVETFCMSQGLRKFLPAHGAPRYTSPKPDGGDNVIVGDNWHLNRGQGKNRRCTECIWNAMHWRQKVEELFMLEADNPAAIELFNPAGDSQIKNHSSFANHIANGIGDFYETLRSPNKKKKRYRKDHWFDSLAMALVAQSIELWFRENLNRRRSAATSRGRSSAGSSEEIGAR